MYFEPLKLTSEMQDRFNIKSLTNIILYLTLKDGNNVIISIEVEKSVEKVQKFFPRKY